MPPKIKSSPRRVKARPAPDWRGLLRTIRPKGPAQQVGGFLLGAVFARAAVSPGMWPFGVAYVAAASHPLAAVAGAFLAYLPYGAAGLVCGAAAVVVLTCRMVLDGTAISRSRGFFPGAAALALLCTKGVIAAAQGPKAVVLLVCEGALCFGFALMLRQAKDPRSPLCLWGRLTAAMGGILALLPWTLWGIISPGRMLAVFLVLCAGTFGGMAAGAAVGACLGGCLDLALGLGPALSFSFCLTGLAAGGGKERERLPAALLGCAACGLCALWQIGLPGTRQGLMECFFAAGVLVLLPESWVPALESAFAGVGAGLERGRSFSGLGTAFSGLSQAVSQLGAAMEALLQTANGPAEPQELGRVYRAACETACRSCKRRESCWQQDYGEVQRVLADLSEPLRAGHGVDADMLPAWFSAKCLRPRQFCGAINDAYRTALRRQAQQKQAKELQKLVGRQYASLGDLLAGMASRSDNGPEQDPALENRVRRVVRAYLPRAKTALCLQSGRLSIDLLVPRDGPEVYGDHSAMLRSLQGALGVQLLPPVTVESAKGAVLRIRQQEALTLKACTAVRKKEGEPVCGDSHRVLHTDDGRGLLLLSDGMGTGARAGEMSHRALDLVCGFVRSGCPLAESTAAVLPVLAARFEEWGFVTLDLWEINLFTGAAAAVKYGAAPGFLLREGRLTRLDARALPAGLEPMEGEAPILHLRLRPGDRLVLVSDGVWEGADLPGLLREQGTLEGQALANLLLEQAGGGDDRTVMVADLLEADQNA